MRSAFARVCSRFVLVAGHICLVYVEDGCGGLERSLRGCYGSVLLVLLKHQLNSFCATLCVSGKVRVCPPLGLVFYRKLKRVKVQPSEMYAQDRKTDLIPLYPVSYQILYTRNTLGSRTETVCISCT